MITQFLPDAAMPSESYFQDNTPYTSKTMHET
jgi:hypothetical protein